MINGEIKKNVYGNTTSFAQLYTATSLTFRTAVYYYILYTIQFTLGANVAMGKTP